MDGLAGKHLIDEGQDAFPDLGPHLDDGKCSVDGLQNGLGSLLSLPESAAVLGAPPFGHAESA